jgi:hypothetical protein
VSRQALEDAEFQFAGELATFLAAEEKHDKHKAAQVPHVAHRSHRDFSQ